MYSPDLAPMRAIVSRFVVYKHAKERDTAAVPVFTRPVCACFNDPESAQYPLRVLLRRVLAKIRGQ